MKTYGYKNLQYSATLQKCSYKDIKVLLANYILNIVNNKSKIFRFCVRWDVKGKTFKV